MTTDSAAEIRLPLNPLTLYGAGRRAGKIVPGLKKRMIGGFLVNLAIFLVISGALFGSLYVFLLRPGEKWMQGWLPDEVDWIATALAWFLPVVGLIFSMAFAVRFSVALMTVWFESLVETVVEHFRPGWKAGDPPGWFGETVRSTTKEMLLMGGTVALGFVPVLGPALVFCLSAILMGRSIAGPYRQVLKSRGEFSEKLPSDRPGPRVLITGLSQMGLVLVPVVGWFFLPWFVTHCVIGRAQLAEEKLAILRSPLSH